MKWKEFQIIYRNNLFSQIIHYQIFTNNVKKSIIEPREENNEKSSFKYIGCIVFINYAKC